MTGFIFQSSYRCFVFVLSATRQVDLRIPLEKHLYRAKVITGILRVLPGSTNIPLPSPCLVLFMQEGVGLSAILRSDTTRSSPVFAPVMMMTFPVRSGMSLGSKVGAGGKCSMRARVRCRSVCIVFVRRGVREIDGLNLSQEQRLLTI